ncbi:MAG: amidohydrolase family protein [Melioribacteraceae bacterium]|nr:amidohydrolase family protein [Melioribacteraceae bacterium]
MKSKKFLIENAWICPVIAEDIIPFFGDIVIEKNKIQKIRPKNFSLFLKNPYKVGKNSFNALGKVITIPNVNFHDHIYSRLAKGLKLNHPLNDFQNILKNLWWKLDNELDEQMIISSANYAAIESIKNGVTYIFDHHSSQSKIENSLTLIKNELKNYNLRSVLCFETTDRNGASKAINGLNENKNFYSNFTDNNTKAMLGLHASFTLSDEILLEAKKMLNDNWGIHIHIAEDESDVKLSKDFTNLTPIQRLRKYKLLNDKSILVHGVHLSKNDFYKIEEFESSLAVCPDSNMNNSVGVIDFNRIPNAISLLMGTDGMHSNVAKSLKQVFLISRNQGFTFNESFSLIKKIYFDQINFVKKYFDDFPLLNENDRADFIIWDYTPPTPLNKENFWGHFIYAILESKVNSVIQNGEFIFENGKLNFIDETLISNEIYLAGEKLYNKFLTK